MDKRTRELNKLITKVEAMTPSEFIVWYKGVLKKNHSNINAPIIHHHHEEQQGECMYKKLPNNTQTTNITKGGDFTTVS